jgi:hypothetical protein
MMTGGSANPGSSSAASIASASARLHGSTSFQLSDIAAQIARNAIPCNRIGDGQREKDG